MRRGLTSVLTSTPDKLIPHTPIVSKVKDKMNFSRTEQMKHYDIGAKTLKLTK